MVIAKDQIKKPNRGFRTFLKVKDLVCTHDLYGDWLEEWRLLLAVYEGIKAIKYYGYIKQHDREEDDAYDRRMEELYGFGYAQSIIDIFHFYLFKKDPKRKLTAIEDNPIWQMFFKDANLKGDSFDEVVMDFSLYASIEGHMGILVDRPFGAGGMTRAQQIANGIYPYIARYFPAGILDWEEDYDEFGKPVLDYVKLLDDNGQYRFWYRDGWEIWELPKDANGEYDESDQEADAVFIASGDNPLGEIPFVWNYNRKSKCQGIGFSDITEIARIDLSIIKNLSQSEEIINFAAFPMLLKPMKSADPTKARGPAQEDVVAVDAVQEFDPETPEAKPQWMETEVADPLKAIIEFIDRKVQEIYRASNAGGMAATEVSTVAKSGAALKSEFQLLNARLVTKAILLEKTESKVVEFWLKWEKLWEQHKDEIIMGRDRSFDIEDLAQDLENAITSSSFVVSDKFNELVQKQTARQVLPSATEKDMAEIDKEIEQGIKEEACKPDQDFYSDDDLNPNGTGGNSPNRGNSGSSGGKGTDPGENAGNNPKMERVRV